MLTACKPRENKISSNQHKFVKIESGQTKLNVSYNRRKKPQAKSSRRLWGSAELSSGLIPHWGKAKPVRWKSDVGCTKLIKNMAQIWSQELTAQK